MKNIFRYQLFLVFLLTHSNSNAQSLERSVIGTLGGSSTPAGGPQLQYNMGETFTATLASGGYMLTQGFEQAAITSPLPSCMPTSGLMAWYPFNGSAYDSTGNGNNGTVNGATATTDRFGMAGRAYSFNGSGDYIQTTYSFPTGGAAKSFSLWYKANTIKRGWLIGGGADNNGQAFGLFMQDASGKILFHGMSIYDVDLGNYTDTSSWHHVVVTFSSDTLKAYVDGALIVSVYDHLTTASSNMVIGRRPNPALESTTDAYFSGKIDDIAIYNRALTQPEVTQLYTGGASAGAITGASSVCAGSTITLADTLAGGTWLSSNTPIAIVSSMGIVTGVAAGTSTISYMITNSCGSSVVTKDVTINALPSAGTITGPSSVSVGSTITLTDAVSGGVWSASNGNATVTNGVVTGVSIGAVTISYTVSNSCGTATATKSLTVTPATCSSWGNTGMPGFSAGGAVYTSIAIDGSGTPYAAFMDAGNANKATVMKYNGSSWVTVGSAGFSDGDAIQISVAVGTGGTPYVVYRDGGHSYKATAMMYNGTNWVAVGSPGFSEGEVYVTSIALDGSGIPYVTYSDVANSNKATVMKYNGSSWVAVGSAGFSAGLANSTFIAINNSGEPYVVYSDYANGQKATVMKYNGSSWVYVGSPGFSAGVAGYTTLAFDNTGTPYIVYRDEGNSAKATAMRFNGSSWVNVGSAGFSAGEALYTSIAIDGGGTVYAAYRDIANASKTTVMMYDGSSWVPTGSAGFSAGDAEYTAMMVDNSGVPYVVYKDNGNGGKATVMKYGSALNSITGIFSLCAGANTTLTDATSGGIWSSSNVSVATISTSGVVTGIASGTSVISYTSGICSTTAVLTVIATPSAGTITGLSSLCSGSVITLSDAVTGGSWNSGDVSVATVSNGIVTGVAAGVASISYTVSNSCGDAVATKSVSVNAAPSLISALNAGAICTGTLFSYMPSGVPSGASFAWSRSVVSGIANSAASGTGNIAEVLVNASSAPVLVTYVYTVSAGGCSAMQNVTVMVNPTPVLSSATSLSVCSNSLFTYNPSSVVTGTSVSWSRDVVTGISNSAATGVGTISEVLVNTTPPPVVVHYVLTLTANGCMNMQTLTVTVNPLPNTGTISGPSSVYPGATITLTDAVSGGTWSSSNTSFATVVGGVVTGISTGVVTISYTVVNGCGSMAATKAVTVNSSVTGIGGTLTVCVGATTTLTNATTGGVWSSSNTAAATIGTANGVVLGMAAGTSVITYSVGGSYAIAVMSVNAVPANILPATLSLCAGATATLTDATTGGTWTSGTTAVATIDAATGIVSGVASGVASITYSVGTGCYKTTNVSVNPVPAPIAGTLSVCAGATTSLSDATVPGLSWTSSNTTVATVNVSTGLVAGVSAGTSVITYSLGTGCKATAVVSVSAALPAIVGPSRVCVGYTTTLSNTTTGGVWTSSNTSAATIGSVSGVVSGLAAGTSVISYSVGGCVKTIADTINSLPGNINGTLIACVGTTTTLNAGSGGNWSSGNTAVATVGVVTGAVLGISPGVATISYISVANGCFTTASVTINPSLPAITGTTTVCRSSVTTLSNAVAGGSWTSSNLSVGTVGSTSGVVTGIGVGSTSISYGFGSGCKVGVLVSVSLPANISPTTASMCVGNTTTFTGTPSGGTWLSSNTSVATTGTSGVVTGLSAGTSAISYTSAGGCAASAQLTVNALPATIGGSSTVCAGSVITLTNAVAGGAWASSNATVGSVDASAGIVTGRAQGVITITYTIGSGCYTTRSVTVNPIGAITSGSLSFSICVGSSITLSDATTGGTWSSSSTGIATIGMATGVVTGIANGTSNISYTTALGCAAGVVVTVTPAASAVVGSAVLCVGQTTTLSSATGGTWTGPAPGVITGPSGGIVTGASPGTATITYTLSTGCTAITIITVNAVPASISGTGTSHNKVCPGASLTLTDFTIGGVWSSSNTGIASISASGTATGGTPGIATITYTLPATGCYSTTGFTVNPNPAPITGIFTLCANTSTTLADATPGGTGWTSSNTAKATVSSSTGIVTGLSAGTANITYALGSGCIATQVITVNACPRPIGNNHAALTDWQLYPNPTSGGFTVEAANAGTLYVYTLEGKELAKYEVSEGVTILSLPKGVAAGVYMCRYRGDDGSTVVVRLVYEP